MIAIVSDSSISLTQKEAAELGIHIVPMTYTVAGRPFHEHYSDTNGAFERLVSHYPCTTSQPASAAFMSTFQELVRQGYEVLCLVISSRLSGTYSSATIAAKEISAEKIRIVDTRTTVGGMRFLAERAKELIAQDAKGLEEVALALEREREKVSILFSVENMAPLRRSGRLGFVRQSISTILNIRPILMCRDGTLVSHGFAKGKRQQIEKIVETVPAAVKKITVLYLGDIKEARDLAAAVTKKFPDLVPSVTAVGPVLGIHLGIPAVGVAWTL